MNILINASLPGCGKSYLLTKLFSEYQPKPYEKVVFVTKTNKALDNARSFLTGEKLEDKSFKTLDQFKENWKIIPVDDNGTERLVHLKTESHISRYYYTLFIDEISMISEYEINDLLQGFLVANIIAAGDTSQHSPIPFCYYEKTSSGLNQYIDDGSPIKSSFWDKTFILNTPYRFKDDSLVNVLDVIKRKDIITPNFLKDNFEFCDSYNEDAYDLHICFTNKEVNDTNSKYENPTRFIINRKWKFNGFNVQNGQFLDKDIRDILINDLTETQNIITPAMAVTSHKLQGWTAQHSHTIYIHLMDFISDKISEEAFMRGLWVALTRAPSLKQIKFYGITPEEAANAINKCIKSNWLQKLNGVECKQDDASISIQTLLDSVEFDKESDPRYIEWIKKYGDAHRGAHKAHKAENLNKDEVEAYKAKHSLRDTAKHFNVSTTTITKLLK